MTEEDRVTLDKAMDFLASSPTHGEVKETENSGSSGSSTPGPAEEEQSFSPLWPGGQFSKAGGRKEGDSGFISPDGATNHGANPFYHQGQGESVKPLDSSLESENDRYENGHQDSSEIDENNGGGYKQYNQLNEQDVVVDKFEPFPKPSFTDFSGLESKLCEVENSRNDAEKALEIITDPAGMLEEKQIIEHFKENQTISEQHELDGNNVVKPEFNCNNLENTDENCFDELDKIAKSADPIKMDSNDYDYKVTQEDGCNILDPRDDSDSSSSSSSSDGEDETEKKEQELPTYEKLSSYEDNIIAGDSKEVDIDGVDLDMKTATLKLEEDITNNEALCETPQTSDVVQLDTEEHKSEVRETTEVLINENFVESNIEKENLAKESVLDEGSEDHDMTCSTPELKQELMEKQVEVMERKEEVMERQEEVMERQEEVMERQEEVMEEQKESKEGDNTMKDEFESNVDDDDEEEMKDTDFDEKDRDDLKPVVDSEVRDFPENTKEPQGTLEFNVETEVGNKLSEQETLTGVTAMEEEEPATQDNSNDVEIARSVDEDVRQPLDQVSDTKSLGNQIESDGVSNVSSDGMNEHYNDLEGSKCVSDGFDDEKVEEDSDNEEVLAEQYSSIHDTPKLESYNEERMKEGESEDSDDDLPIIKSETLKEAQFEANESSPPPAEEVLDMQSEEKDQESYIPPVDTHDAEKLQTLIPTIEIDVDTEEVEVEKLKQDEPRTETLDNLSNEPEENSNMETTEFDIAKEKKEEAEDMQAVDTASNAPTEAVARADANDLATKEELGNLEMDENEYEMSNVETKIDSEVEPRIEMNEGFIPVEEPVKVLLDAETNKPSNEPIAVNDPADDASIETTGDNQQDLDDKVTNDTAMENKPAVEEEESVPASLDILKEDQTKSAEDCVRDQLAEPDLDIKEEVVEAAVDVKEESIEASDDIKEDVIEASVDVKEDIIEAPVDVKEDIIEAPVHVKEDVIEAAVHVKEDVIEDETPVDVKEDVIETSVDVKQDNFGAPVDVIEPVTVTPKDTVTETVVEDVKEQVTETVVEDVKEQVTETVVEDVKEQVTETVVEEVKEQVDETVVEEVKEQVTEAAVDTKNEVTEAVDDSKNGVTEVAVAAVTAAGVVAVGATAATKKSPKPPSTLALTKTTTGKPAGKQKELSSTKTAPKPRGPASKPLVPPSSRTTTRVGSATTSRTTPATRTGTSATPRPATAPQRPTSATTTSATPRRPISRPDSGVQRPSSRPATARTTRAETKPAAKPAAPAPAKTGPVSGLKKKLTPRTTSTSRLREASAARVKVDKKPSPTSPTPRTPLSHRVPSASTPTKPKTPTKPSSGSASSKELPNTPFARARQARLAAAEKKTSPAANRINGH